MITENFFSQIWMSINAFFLSQSVTVSSYHPSFSANYSGDILGKSEIFTNFGFSFVCNDYFKKHLTETKYY